MLFTFFVLISTQSQNAPVFLSKIDIFGGWFWFGRTLGFISSLVLFFKNRPSFSKLFDLATFALLFALQAFVCSEFFTVNFWMKWNYLDCGVLFCLCKISETDSLSLFFSSVFSTRICNGVLELYDQILCCKKVLVFFKIPSTLVRSRISFVCASFRKFL